MKLVVNGERTFCYTNAREIVPDRDSIIFVHGSGLDHTVWTLAARHFARHGNNVIAVDLPGHGRSTGEPLDAIEAMADWLVALMDALGVGTAAVVGHSLGSLVAMDCAARHPTRVRALAMVGTTVPMPVSDAILNAAEANDHAAFDMLTQWGYSKRHQYGGNRNSGIWMIGSTLRLFERSRPGVLFSDMTACNNYRAGIERAAKVSCPVLLVLGSEDRLTPVRSTQPLREAFVEPKVEILPGAGHTIMVEEPNALLDALHRVLN
ncbi:alpha/beta hydrolase [Halieaceae bacterium]|nr:alpha/beta hydrolase [Halieaceae bacterium]